RYEIKIGGTMSASTNVNPWRLRSYIGGTLIGETAGMEVDNTGSAWEISITVIHLYDDNFRTITKFSAYYDTQIVQSDYSGDIATMPLPRVSLDPTGTG